MARGRSTTSRMGCRCGCVRPTAVMSSSDAERCVTSSRASTRCGGLRGSGRSAMRRPCRRTSTAYAASRNGPSPVHTRGPDCGAKPNGVSPPGNSPAASSPTSADSTQGCRRASPRYAPCGDGSARPDGSQRPQRPRSSHGMSRPRPSPRLGQGRIRGRARPNGTGTVLAGGTGHPPEAASHGASPKCSSRVTRRATGRPTTVAKSPSMRSTSDPPEP